MAFLYFYENNCDYVVLETGLGGREDATNIVKTTILSVLTSISEDHIGMIGNNIEEIAYTKAGIIKQGVPAIMINTDNRVSKVIEEECKKLDSKLYIIDEDDISDIIKGMDLSSAGAYQPYNAALALTAIKILGEYEKWPETDYIKTREAISRLTIPYRMEKISDDPLFYLDGAHNPDAAVRLKETVESMFRGRKLIFIMGMFKDKDYGEVVKIMAPLASHIITVQTPDSPRALAAAELKSCIESYDLCKADVEALSIDEALMRSLSLSRKYEEQGYDPCILAFGSLSYLKYLRR